MLKVKVTDDMKEILDSLAKEKDVYVDLKTYLHVQVHLILSDVPFAVFPHQEGSIINIVLPENAEVEVHVIKEEEYNKDIN